MSHQRTIPILISFALILIFWWVSKSMTSVLAFIPVVLVSYVFQIRYFNTKGDIPENLLTLYLLALANQLLHFTEEYLTGFISKLPALFGQEPYPENVFVAFNMIAYAVFIIGALIIHKRWIKAMIIPLFFIFAGVFLNSLAHIFLSVYTTGYFPGLITAIIYLCMIPLFLKLFFQKQEMIMELN